MGDTKVKVTKETLVAKMKELGNQKKTVAGILVDSEEWLRDIRGQEISCRLAAKEAGISFEEVKTAAFGEAPPPGGEKKPEGDKKEGPPQKGDMGDVKKEEGGDETEIGMVVKVTGEDGKQMLDVEVSDGKVKKVDAKKFKVLAKDKQAEAVKTFRIARLKARIAKSKKEAV